MECINYTTTKEKFKHLSLNDYRIIESDYNHFIKTKKPLKNKTCFMKELASKINTCLSNLYKIIQDGLVCLKNSDLTDRIEFSSDAAWKNRQNIIPNNFKAIKCQEFISLVVNRFKKKDNIESIEIIVKDLILNHSEELKDMDIVCVKTIYNYINLNKLSIKRMDLPIAVKRKNKAPKTEYCKTRGTSIDLRPIEINKRLEFGHWEGDTVVGVKGKDDAVLFTLVERKTRFAIIMKVKDKTSKSIYMAINKLEKQYKTNFSKIFKSITFDNGKEFARFKHIEKKVNTKTKRTTVYFAHPYASYERGTNERHNRIIRKFIPKGKPINDYSKEFIEYMKNIINNCVKKILGYKTSECLFNQELSLI